MDDAAADPLDDLTDVVYERDLEGRILRINLAGERLFGWPRGELQGRTLHGGPETAAYRSLQATNARLLAEGRDRSTVTLRAAGGLERVFETVTSLLRGADGGPIGARGVMRDVTQQVELAAALEAHAAFLREANASLEAAQRDRAQLLAMLVHDLRTPLTVMAATLEVLGGKPGHEPYLDVARASAQQMAHLIDDILDLHRPLEALALHRESIGVEELLEGAVAQGRLVAGRRGIGLGLRVDAGLPALAVDAGRMRRVMGNLLSNAIKFSPAQGQVDVHAAHRGAAVEIAVHDQGPGVAPEDVEGLFEPYVQGEHGRRQGGGTGLGLAVVRRLVDAHGGSVRVEGGRGHGSTFVVRLPLS